MNLIIVESPTKAKTLSRFLGSSYGVEATMGHIKDLPKSKLGVDVDKNFAPDYQPMVGKEEAIKNIETKSKKAGKIYIATDPDREGEAIANHVKEIVGNGKTKRIVFHEITKEAVEEAIAHPRGIDHHLVDAQIARRVLDRLVGYKLSPILWKKVRRGLSAGRVQTVAVRLIVEREREIEKFKAQEYWEIYCDVKKDQQFRVQLINKKVDNKKTADKVVHNLKKAKYVVANIKRSEVKKNPYPPFTTSTMSQTASRLFGWSARRTMSTAQKLYERGLITYHRTDSVNIAVSAVAKTREYIKAQFGDRYLPDAPRFYKTTSKSAQEAHEAIRPTKPDVSQPKIKKTKWSADMVKLYSLIWKRFVACQMATSIFDRTTIDVKAGDYLLRASGQILKFDGWKKLYAVKMEADDVILPEVAVGVTLQLVKVDPQQKFTQPPAKFNEASLIKTLEELGVGRPSTYAPIISTIQTRQYVEKSEGKFTPTNIGIAVADFLVKNFESVFEYDFTAEMENDLDRVADGDKKWQGVIGGFYKPFEKKLKSVEKNAKRVKIETEKLNKPCPKCGKESKGELVVRVGRFGKFVSCSRFPDCDYTDRYEERIGMRCPDCKKGHVIIKKTGKWKKFFGCSRYPDCKWASWKDPRVKKEKTAS
ncbi:DNA topoisomerase I [Candidatus Woesebacteria bacterium RIFCSPHIGHO2_01_FULL_44_10]|uniref:DNA topoisomerase 1 n=1 Tax=Candidatus Woesebacteria bacterium RIFCSPLOWO2_01_FULL_44_14 TaxID=1802525 RepID=A0A1F8C3R4_9BACT|nr:MAG: DNA topoisomerase I [Candidatus Woesebacteria bacterium RIFCSPHIGHO2_01_FULL_44_10]OGM70922.1 MAG: DNA topoisomerase I [Candidatus Woesebacteria bacterium RIFCSPLOWO2_01_FULL_44_14]